MDNKWVEDAGVCEVVISSAHVPPPRVIRFLQSEVGRLLRCRWQHPTALLRVYRLFRDGILTNLAPQVGKCLRTSNMHFVQRLPPIPVRQNHSKFRRHKLYTMHRADISTYTRAAEITSLSASPIRCITVIKLNCGHFIQKFTAIWWYWYTRLN